VERPAGRAGCDYGTSGFVSTVGAAIIGLVAGVLVCLSCAFIENVMKVDDPVGAISVHGTNGLWGFYPWACSLTARVTTEEAGTA